MQDSDSALAAEVVHLIKPMCLLDQKQQALKGPVETQSVRRYIGDDQSLSMIDTATHSSSSAGTLRMKRVHKSSNSSVLGCRLAVIRCNNFSK